MVTVAGIDPGLVHTGVVSMTFDRTIKTVWVASYVIDGPDAAAVKAVLEPRAVVFIEGYRPRSNFSTDARMAAAVTDMRKATGGAVLQNMGVKKIVKSPLMEMLHVWKFDQVTHHQDLRSAARIALFGMLKDDHLNQLLTTVVADHLSGEDWDVHS